MTHLYYQLSTLNASLSTMFGMHYIKYIYFSLSLSNHVLFNHVFQLGIVPGNQALFKLGK
jgi:hypothetical protein